MGCLPTSLDGVKRQDQQQGRRGLLHQPDAAQRAGARIAAGEVAVTVTMRPAAAAPPRRSCRPSRRGFSSGRKSLLSRRARISRGWAARPVPRCNHDPRQAGRDRHPVGHRVRRDHAEVLSGTTVDGVHTVTTNPTIRVGGAGVEFLGAALSPGSAGLYQIAVRVPNPHPTATFPWRPNSAASVRRITSSSR